MSVEEELELRDLVAQTLETNGCLAKIRAQLRASIFLALDEDTKISKQEPLLNNRVKTCLETEEGKAMFCVVREFLEFFNLYFTISVFEPESYLGSGYQYEGRQKVSKDLGLDVLEDTTVPLLLQIIKIAQGKGKSLEINLNMNSESQEKSLMQDVDTTSDIKKTDSDNTTGNDFTDNEKSLVVDVKSVQNPRVESDRLNTTFNVSSPTININGIHDTEQNPSRPQNEASAPVLNSTYSKNDDTSEDTSSIAEDTLINLDGSTNIPELNLNGVDEKNALDDTEVSQPVLKDSKAEKPKSQKPEKKSKNNLSSLSDLPPLQLNKSHVSDILPSLYSKEFKDKSNLQELDKLFDMEADYEEDFICSGDDLSLKSDYLKADHSRINLLDDLQVTNKTDKSSFNKKNLKQKTSNRVADCNMPSMKARGNSTKNNDDTVNTNGSSSNSSVSENLEVTASD